MRLAIVLAIAACGTGRQPRPVPLVPDDKPVHSCGDAAAGIERATRSLRAPDSSVLAPMRSRCDGDQWSPAAVECFTAMTIDDLGSCAGRLDVKARDAMLAVLAGQEPGPAAVAAAVARLANVKVGVDECDHFVEQVAAVMACVRIPIETRLSLAAQTVDMWSLPTEGLHAAEQHKMAAACDAALKELKTQVSAAGCDL